MCLLSKVGCSAFVLQCVISTAGGIPLGRLAHHPSFTRNEGFTGMGLPSGKSRSAQVKLGWLAITPLGKDPDHQSTFTQVQVWFNWIWKRVLSGEKKPQKRVMELNVCTDHLSLKSSVSCHRLTKNHLLQISASPHLHWKSGGTGKRLVLPGCPRMLLPIMSPHSHQASRIQTKWDLGKQTYIKWLHNSLLCSYIFIFSEN